MKRILIISGMIIGWSAVMHAQSEFWTLLKQCNDEILSGDRLHLRIDVSAYALNAPEVAIDETGFSLYVHRGELYTQVYDILTLRNDSLILHLDQEDQDGTLERRRDTKGLPSWLQTALPGWVELEQGTSVKLIDHSKGWHKYIVKDLETKKVILECVLSPDKKKIDYIVQYPMQKINHAGTRKSVRVEMKFNYQKADLPLRIRDIVRVREDQLHVQSKYAQYDIADNRKRALTH